MALGQKHIQRSSALQARTNGRFAAILRFRVMGTETAGDPTMDAGTSAARNIFCFFLLSCV